MRMYKAVLLSLLTFSLIPIAQAETPQTFSFTGAGYGHGVGMSQMGARAHALLVKVQLPSLITITKM